MPFLRAFSAFLFLLGASLQLLPAQAGETNLVQNPGFEEISTGQTPPHYELKGNASWTSLARSGEMATSGIIFLATAGTETSVGQLITGIDQTKGRWILFRMRGRAADTFYLNGDTLKMKIEFYSKGGTNYLDCASRPLSAEIEMDRKNLTVNGDFHRNGADVWRTYELEELLPFPEVDAVRISVSYVNPRASGDDSATFSMDDFSLVQHQASVTGRVDPAVTHPPGNDPPVNEAQLVSLGGRWYYRPAKDEKIAPSTEAPLKVTDENADRLFYKSDRLINPFLHNMTAWRRTGYLDTEGKPVTKDEFVPDNVVLTFKGDGFLTLHSHNLPNHPTAQFPGFNPSYIQEMDQTFRLPLDPRPNPDAKAADESNRNRALPMGPIGVAVNGVVFFNPFDAGMEDASNIMDFCCGHPNPDNQYHYHKYPICVNTPFVDKGAGHSQVLGFAFDGLPLYGPYEEAGVMAKDSTTNPLNAFNAHRDPVRGWHYHVTPGKFPYLIGGFYAEVEPGNLARRHGGPPGGGGRRENRPPPGGGDDFYFPPPPPPGPPAF